MPEAVASVDLVPEEFLVEIVGPDEFNLSAPVAVVDVYAVGIGDGSEEEIRALVIPLDPAHEDELLRRLPEGPMPLVLPWDPWGDDETVRAVIGGAVVDLHQPPGRITLDDAGNVVYEDAELRQGLID